MTPSPPEARPRTRTLEELETEVEVAWVERYDELARHRKTLERAERAEAELRELQEALRHSESEKNRYKNMVKALSHFNAATRAAAERLGIVVAASSEEPG